MSSRRGLAAVALLAAVLGGTEPAFADSAECQLRICPDITPAPGALTASYVDQTGDGNWRASNESAIDAPYTFRLQTPCEVDTDAGDTCRPDDDNLCPSPPDRIVQVMVIERQRLVLADGSTIDGFDSARSAPGTPVGPWQSVARACVDITALNPPPSPGEVFRYFQELPLPRLATQQQPPGNGLVGLPTIFYTDGPTTQAFTLDIRGFTVDIVAGATAFAWDTGDGTVLTTTEPGAAYPDHTITHDYSSGTYTASLTTTWGATFSVDGGASVAVPGTTTTQGAPVTFTVLQARTVLTNPYD